MSPVRGSARAVAGATAVVLAAALAVVPAGGASAAPPVGVPRVYPTPRSVTAHGGGVPLGPRVALVAGADADPAAVRVVRTALEAAGVRRIERAADLGDVRGGRPAITVDAGDDLGLPDAADLPAEGYVLGTGRVRGHGVVALNGHDATGTYYAAQTLRQLLTRRAGRAWVPGVVIKDWPELGARGVIEGFYGTPWSQRDRLDQLDYYGAHKMNTYVYSPKDDPYPDDRLTELKELVTRAESDHVRFTYALSPGLSVCYSSDDDLDALVAKFQSLYDIGVRDFAVPLDDISYTEWNCDADAERFGSGGAAAGAAQAYLLNRVQEEFVAAHPDVTPLQMVPTEYSDVADSPYKTALREHLSDKVVVEWTGVGVIAPAITAEQAGQAGSVYGHPILVWDNYPVNDYVTDRLLLGPYSGRQPGIASSLYGITANPMIQAEASKIALSGVADFTWNPEAYDAGASWQAALTELSGGDPRARAALAAFADLEYGSDLNPRNAPVLAGKVAAFWRDWSANKPLSGRDLDAYLARVEGIPSVLRTRLHDDTFTGETGPWLDAAGYWGRAARAALRMLRAQRAGDDATARTEREHAETYRAKAESYTYTGMRGTVTVKVGDGVLDTFVTDALAGRTGS